MSQTAAERDAARTIDIFMDSVWAGAGELSVSGRIERCSAVLSPTGDLDETITVCDVIEAAIAQGSPQSLVTIAGHDYAWSLASRDGPCRKRGA